uniref:Uncharacterized protein n=1 Tax=viral metagenome TaxID=1070528 RepID=A0A2V0RAP7_9ZZZZ
MIPDVEDEQGLIALFVDGAQLDELDKALDALEASTEDENLTWPFFYYELDQYARNTASNTDYQWRRRFDLIDMRYHARRGNGDKYGFVDTDPEYEVLTALLGHDFNGAYELTYQSPTDELTDAETTIWNSGYPPYKVSLEGAPDEILDLFLEMKLYTDDDYMYLSPQSLDGKEDLFSKALDVVQGLGAISAIAKGNWHAFILAAAARATEGPETLVLNNVAESVDTFPLKPPTPVEDVLEEVEEIEELVSDDEVVEDDLLENDGIPTIDPEDDYDTLPFLPPDLDIDLPDNLGLYFGLLVGIVGVTAAIDILTDNMLDVPDWALERYAPEMLGTTEPDKPDGPDRDEESEVEPEPEVEEEPEKEPVEAWFWHDLPGEMDIDENIPVEERVGYEYHQEKYQNE